MVTMRKPLTDERLEDMFQMHAIAARESDDWDVVQALGELIDRRERELLKKAPEDDTTEPQFIGVTG